MLSAVFTWFSSVLRRDRSVRGRINWNLDCESSSGGTCVSTDCRRCFKRQGGFSEIATICVILVASIVAIPVAV